MDESAVVRSTLSVLHCHCSRQVFKMPLANTMVPKYCCVECAQLLIAFDCESSQQGTYLL